MKEYPLISVIVPVYGAEEYFDRCVGSLVEQTYPNLEILLLDDASPDSSGKMCDIWAQRDSRIRVIHKENSGTGDTRNLGMNIARGAYIAFLDCDDYLHPDMYMHLYSLMDAETDIAECGYIKTTVDDVDFGAEEPVVRVCSRQEAMGMHIREEAFCQLVWNKLYSREVIGDIRFIPEERMDDEFFTYRVLARARKLVTSSRICHAYRQREGSIVHQTFSVKRVESLRARQKRMDYISANMPQLEQEARVDLVMACVFMMQNSLKHLKGKEFEEAEAIIGNAMKAALPVKADGIALKRRVFLTLAQWNLKGTSRLLNFLMDIHVLS